MGVHGCTTYPCPVCYPPAHTTINQFPSVWQNPRLSDEDVERIAKRVADLLKDSA